HVTTKDEEVLDFPNDATSADDIAALIKTNNVKFIQTDHPTLGVIFIEVTGKEFVSMNIARIQAIFEKDLKDFMKNTATIFMPIVPIFLAFFYNKMGEDGGESLPLMVVYIVVGVTFSTIAAGSMMILMAEENEKKTLRG